MKRITIAMLVSVFLFAALFGCGGRRYIMAEKDISKDLVLPEETPYCVIWAEINPILERSEPGRNHYLHFENGDSFLGARVYVGNQKKFMIVAHKSEIDLTQKAVISSRSGKRFYSLDGKEIYSKDGFLVPEFNWAKIASLKESEIKIWQNILPGSEEDKNVQAISTGIGKEMDRQYPNLFERALSRVAKITTEDIVLAGATDFTSLFGIFGIRAWVLVEAFVEKADLSLPYYDTALVNRFQMALEVAPVFVKIDNAVEQYYKDRALWWKLYGEDMK
ncbi:hypothetical protein KKG85_02350 [Patescibacteria group bacterium]|nr:hypothetical protein [Patescibacteria group bacterium]MBU2579925.1 hypothetical protein [Patescibacteria group bacterium]